MTLESDVAREILSDFDNIQNPNEYRAMATLYWTRASGKKSLNPNTLGKLAFATWSQIYHKLDLSDQKARDVAEERFRNLIKFNYVKDFKYPLQRSLEDIVSGLVLGRTSKLVLKVENFSNLDYLIQSWQSTGLRLDPGNVVRLVAKKMKRSGIEKNPESIQRAVRTLGQYSHSDSLFAPYQNWTDDYWKAKRSKPELKKEIIRRANRKRDVVNGRHTRDSQLAAILKKYYTLECTSCGRRTDEEKIELSHKIPLSLGIANYAFDSPVNMELLCHECHQRYERTFNKNYDSLSETAQKEKVKKMHESQLRLSEWAEHVDKSVFDIDAQEIVAETPTVLKCSACMKRYNNVEECKSCGAPMLPVGHRFFKSGS